MKKKNQHHHHIEGLKYDNNQGHFHNFDYKKVKSKMFVSCQILYYCFQLWSQIRNC